MRQMDVSLPPERKLDLPDAAATRALGAKIARVLRPGDVVCLFGGLGAGKTTLARGVVAELLGADTETPSPTYTLVQVYEGPDFDLWHADLYRLERPEETVELGLEEAFETAASLIEWPERLGDLIPGDRLEVHLDETSDGARRARLVGVGAWRERIDGI